MNSKKKSISMVFQLDSHAQDVSGRNEQSIQTLGRGALEARGPMQLHRLHRLKAGPVTTHSISFQSRSKFFGNARVLSSQLCY